MCYRVVNNTTEATVTIVTAGKTAFKTKHMNTRTKKAFDLLLVKTNYIIPRKSFTGIDRWCVYDKVANPLLVISDASYQSLRCVLVDKKDRSYLSRRLVQQQHGKSYFKMKYSGKIVEPVSEVNDESPKLYTRKQMLSACYFAFEHQIAILPNDTVSFSEWEREYFDKKFPE